MTLLVGTVDGLFALRDGREPDALLGGEVRALSAAGGRECWAVLDHRSLARRGPDGSWTVAHLDVTARLTTVLATAAGTLVGTADARLWRVDDGTVERVGGFDRVAGRDAWHAVGSATPYVRSLSATVDESAVLASVHVGGIPRSTDRGATWEPTLDVEADVHEVRAHPSIPGVVMAAAAVGLVESRDGGSTWAVAPTAGLHATYLRSVAFPSGAVVVGASDGPVGRRAALYRRPLTGGDFARCTDGLPAWLPALVDTGALDAHGSAVVAGAADTVVTSDDAGETWRVAAAGLPRVRAVALTDHAGAEAR